MMMFETREECLEHLRENYTNPESPSMLLSFSTELNN